MANYGYLYKTINKYNGKFYVGKRKGKFDTDYYGSGIAIKNAIKKYGKDSFCMRLIDCAETSGRLNQMEKEYIAYCRKKYGKERLYNISDGGDGGATMTGRKHSRESKEKIRLSHLGQPSGMKGKHFSKEAKEKSRKSHLGKTTFNGRHHTKETKQKMRKAKLGIKRKSFTKEHRKNISKNHVGMKGKKHTPETLKKLKRIAIERYKNNPNCGFRKGHIPWNKKINKINI